MSKAWLCFRVIAFAALIGLWGCVSVHGADVSSPREAGLSYFPVYVVVGITLVGVALADVAFGGFLVRLFARVFGRGASSADTTSKTRETVSKTPLPPGKDTSSDTAAAQSNKNKTSTSGPIKSSSSAVQANPSLPSNASFAQSLKKVQDTLGESVAANSAKDPATKENYDGVVGGKYGWKTEKWGDYPGTPRKYADVDMGIAITKYGWSDGKTTVSVYVELGGLDDVPDEDITTTCGDKECSLTVIMGSPPKARCLTLKGLTDEIDEVKLQRKSGKNTVVLKLKKRDVKSWSKLLANSGDAKNPLED